MTEESTKPQAPELITVKEFFETVPPGRMATVSNVGQKTPSGGPISPIGSSVSGPNYYYRFLLPTLQLHCETQSCNGFRLFDTQRDGPTFHDKPMDHFVTYVCRNCGEQEKTYALRSLLDADEKNGKLFKFGEVPPFGPPTPARVISLIGPEKEYYLKGRRAENQGMGIAAFAYYRRVIENQKDRILDEIIRVTKKINADEVIINELNAAKRETQFSKAVGQVKHGIPQVLLINGHDPLTLLHSELSEGLHAQTDEQCLESATSIRIVLTALVERMSNALKDEAELDEAVNRLLRAKSKQ